MSSRKTTVILLSLLFITASIFFYFYFKASKAAENDLPLLGTPGHIVGQFQFVNQDGDTVTDQDVANKVRVVEYFFTTCKGICPRMNENMTKVYDAYKGDNNFIILSHTVNPEVDTPAVLARYAEKFGADPAYWEFLTGDKQELYDMARFSYLLTASDPTPDVVAIEDDFIHSESFILVDKKGRIRGIYDGTNMDEVNDLIGDVKTLLDEKSN